MTSWPPPGEAYYRAGPPQTFFERALHKRPKPPAPPPPEAVVRALWPPPGVPVLWCTCGAAVALERGRPRSTLERQYIDNWADSHRPPGHRVARDYYRAACRPFVTGCRNCGSMPPRPLRFYCSDECRKAFERDHFWGTAASAAQFRQTVYDRETHQPAGVVCARCGERCARWEVNHIVPLNGIRPFFGCMHHLDGLELLDHACHVAVTAEQRAAGLFR